MLAAFSITILLFTVVHSRHLVPSHRHPTHPGSVLSSGLGGGFTVEKDCGGLFYADEVLRCVNMKMERKKGGGMGIGAGGERKKEEKVEQEERERGGGHFREEGEKEWL